MTTLPLDPITAVTHADPYPYYAALLAEAPVNRNRQLAMWVAADAHSVTAVLESSLCRVRPPSEPVPGPLRNRPAGDIFSRLVRMNDGTAHGPLKQAIAAVLTRTIDCAAVAAQTDRWAARLIGDASPPAGAALNHIAFALPVHVIGTLLGVPGAQLPAVAQATADFVRGIAPHAGPEAVARSHDAAAQLLALFDDMLQHAAGNGLLAALVREAGPLDVPARGAVIANAIGLLSQAWEATAGLIGNSLVALARHPDVLARVRHDRGVLRHVVAEVLRHDPPVQNTRRYVARDGIVAGQPMKAGDAILVVLAAANRDPAANPDPARFDIARPQRRCFTFGAGVHACPGARMAAALAEAGVARVLAASVDPRDLLPGLSYRPSVNTRIPVFAG